MDQLQPGLEGAKTELRQLFSVRAYDFCMSLDAPRIIRRSQVDLRKRQTSRPCKSCFLDPSRAALLFFVVQTLALSPIVVIGCLAGESHVDERRQARVDA